MNRRFIENIWVSEYAPFRIMHNLEDDQCCIHDFVKEVTHNSIPKHERTDLNAARDWNYLKPGTVVASTLHR